MSNSDYQEYPLLGIGWLSTVDDEHFNLYLLILELIFFAMLEGFLWILFVLCLGIYYGSAFKHDFVEMIKKSSLFFLPKVESEVAEEDSKEDEDEVGEKITHGDTEKFSRKDYFSKPDEESVGWINDALEKLWNGCLLPTISTEILNKIVEDVAEEIENEEPSKAALLRKISVERMNLGSCPLQISRIEPHVNQRDELKLDITVEYPGNAELVVKWDDPELYAIGKNLGFKISFQVDIDPIHRDLSLFGGLSCSLIEQPEIMLEGAGMIYLPVELVMKLINIVLKPILSWLVLDPRCVTLSLSDEEIHWPQLELPAGMLRIFLLEGRNLIAADRSIFGTCGFKKRGSSDPFCKLVVDRMIIYSHVVDKTTNPVWEFYAEFPIINPSEQELIMELYDEDIGAESDYLGETSVSLSSLDLKGKVSESWLDVRTVEACSGQIRARLQWVPCLPSAPSATYRERPQTESYSQAILSVHIRRVHTNSKIEPVVCLQISGEQLQTTTKGNSGQEYEFEEEMMLLVRDPDTDWVRFALLDLNKNSFNAGRMFKKGLSLLHGENDALSSDLVAHKGKEVLNMPLVGDICFPVKMFTDKRELTSIRLRSKSDVEARICFTAKLEFLEVPIENIM